MASVSLDLTAVTGFGLGQRRPNRRRQDIATYDGESTWGVFYRRLLDHFANHYRAVRPHVATDDPVLVLFSLRHFHDRHHASASERAVGSAQLRDSGTSVAIKQVIGKQHRDGSPLRGAACTRHRVPQTQGLFLANRNQLAQVDRLSAPIE